MSYSDLIDTDITVYSEFGDKYRGILRKIHESDGILEFEVGIDKFFVRADRLYALTVHGISPNTE